MTDLLQKLILALVTAALITGGGAIVLLNRIDVRVETLEAVVAAALAERQRNDALQRAKATSLRDQHQQDLHALQLRIQAMELAR